MFGVSILYNNLTKGLVGTDTNFTPYVISKFGVVGLTKSVALETA